jgi:hypothetical protein
MLSACHSSGPARGKAVRGRGSRSGGLIARKAHHWRRRKRAATRSRSLISQSRKVDRCVRLPALATDLPGRRILSRRSSADGSRRAEAGADAGEWAAIEGSRPGPNRRPCRSNILAPAGDRYGPESAGEVPGAARCDQPRPPLARPGQTSRGSRPGRVVQRLVHRGIRYTGFQGYQGTARRAPLRGHPQYDREPAIWS